MNPFRTRVTYVVVYLIRAREFVIVPDFYVQDLNSAKLYNNGCNSNQDFLVFVSMTNGEVNLHQQPNFNAPLSSRLENTMAYCFMCRIKQFFG